MRKGSSKPQSGTDTNRKRLFDKPSLRHMHDWLKKHIEGTDKDGKTLFDHKISHLFSGEEPIDMRSFGYESTDLYRAHLQAVTMCAL
jgi:hypothetical protein